AIISVCGVDASPRHRGDARMALLHSERGLQQAPAPILTSGTLRTSADLSPNCAWMLWDTAARGGGRAAVSERGATTTYAALVAHVAPLLVETLPPAASLEPVERIGSDVAELIYTSGSTGLPKGVTLSHANLWAGTRAVIGYLGITGDDRIASLLPFSFDYGCNQLLCAVATGATLVVERSSVPQHIAAALRASEVTV